MSEKLASTEIAQSRERLVSAREKWMGDGDTAMRTPFRVRDAFDAGYQAAERDTRERCAQERKELLKNLASAMRKVLPSQLFQEVIDRCDPLSAFLREIGEQSLTKHIRGKV